jgi:hypothetical protein
MSFITQCQKYYNDAKKLLNENIIKRHEYTIGKFMSFVVPSGVEPVKLEVDSKYLNDYLKPEELKKVALKQMERECQDIQLISDELTEEALTVIKYCIKTGQQVINGAYKFICTLNVEELLKSFGEVISNISLESIKKIVKFVKTVVRKIFDEKNFEKIKRYIEGCKWFKFCKQAFGMIINFINKLLGKKSTRDLVEVEGVMINVPSKSLAEAYQIVMGELKEALEC